MLFCLIALPAANASADSLIDPDSYTALVSDKRAFRIGDTITIIIAEQTTAESRADTGRSRDINIEVAGNDTTRSPELGFDLDSSQNGAAITRRTGGIRGLITATVVELNDIGHLVVEGQQVLIVNGEEQSIRVIGTLRPEDIDNSNTVPSSRLTNSRIEFTGDGLVSQAQKPGLIGRVFRFLGLN